jgi:hypothetical protein
VAALLGAVVALGALGGCAAARGATGGPATVEEIAARTGCGRPQMQVDAADIRQGVCKTSKGQYSVTTFATEKGKQEWLEDALDYGGAYLIGTRWIVLGNTREMLESFRATLGGSVRMGGHMAPSGGPAPEGHTMAPGEPMPQGHSMPPGQHATPMP